MIPVIDLAAVAGCKPATGLNILLITEYARSVQAFAVESVENIMRLDWKQVHAAETAVSGRYITSIACGREDGYQRSGDGAGRGADPVRHHPGEPRSARHPSGNHQI